MPTKDELLANGKSTQEMCNYLKASSLKFLRRDGLHSFNWKFRNSHYPNLAIIISQESIKLNPRIVFRV